MRIAAIDIGTNTILLLVADVAPDGSLTIVHDEQVIARMGKGVDAERRILPETMDRVAGFLSVYKTTCDRLQVDRITAAGTSALRDAQNKEAFIAAMKERTGIAIEVLSGEDEALWTYRGGISEFLPHDGLFSVVDIGGGSTEVIIGDASSVHQKVSMDIGSVRLTERFLKNSPPEPDELMATYDHILSTLKQKIPPGIKGTRAIGVAGTVTTIAAMTLGLKVYDRTKVSGHRFDAADTGRQFAWLKDRTASQIVSPLIPAGRADILLAGTMVLMGYLEVTGLAGLTASDRGLRYGLVYRSRELSGQ